jgi:hypothetical protein
MWCRIPRENDFFCKCSLNGPLHEIFDLWFFFIKQIPLGPDTRVKAFLNMASNLWRKLPIFVTAVSMSPLLQQTTPIFLCESYRYSVGKFAYVCFFDRYSL